MLEHNVTPRSAEEWAKVCAEQKHGGYGPATHGLWLCLDCARAFAAQGTAVTRERTLEWAAKHYGCDKIGPDCPGKCIARCEDLPNLRVQIATLRAELKERIATALDVARAEEREDVLLYLRQTLAKNHPHLADAYEHAAKNIEAGAAALRALEVGDE